MKTIETNISAAIARSISHNEKVTVTVTDQKAALAEIRAIRPDLYIDKTDLNDGSLDVWGCKGESETMEFRLVLANA